MTGEPPFDAGGVKATTACALPPVTAPIVGAPGTPAGVTLFDAAEAGPVPIALVAVTVNVYAVPFSRPLTVIGEVAPLAVIPPGEDVAMYEVTGEPPLEAGGVNATVACALPATAVPMVGAPGADAGVTLTDAEAGPVPAAFAAVTEHAFDYLDAPPMRVAQKDVPLPYAANLEKLSLPNAHDIVEAARKVCYVE